MSEGKLPSRIPRRIGAVVAGVLGAVVLSTATDAVLHATAVFPPVGQSMAGGLFVMAAAYRQVYGVAGAYITARLAPDRPMLHAIVLGVLGFVVSIAGAVATWNRGPEFGPKWYPLTLVVLAIPCALVGGKLAEIRSARGSEGKAMQAKAQTTPTSRS